MNSSRTCRRNELPAYLDRRLGTVDPVPQIVPVQEIGRIAQVRMVKEVHPVRQDLPILEGGKPSVLTFQELGWCRRPGGRAL